MTKQPLYPETHSETWVLTDLTQCLFSHPALSRWVLKWLGTSDTSQEIQSMRKMLNRLEIPSISTFFNNMSNNHLDSICSSFIVENRKAVRIFDMPARKGSLCFLSVLVVSHFLEVLYKYVDIKDQSFAYLIYMWQCASDVPPAYNWKDAQNCTCLAWNAVQNCASISVGNTLTQRWYTQICAMSKQQHVLVKKDLKGIGAAFFSVKLPSSLRTLL